MGESKTISMEASGLQHSRELVQLAPRQHECSVARTQSNSKAPIATPSKVRQRARGRESKPDALDKKSGSSSGCEGLQPSPTSIVANTSLMMQSVWSVWSE